MAEPVDLVLFDLVGVLIDVPGVHAMLELTRMRSEEDIASWPLTGLFDHWFLSFELACSSPTSQPSRRSQTCWTCQPSGCCSSTTNAVNVEGAVMAGFQVTRTAGVDEARQRLIEAAVLGAAA